MQNLESFITHYLTKETQYAVLINGKWGRGKTYYFKHTLYPLITSAPIPSNEKNKYRVAYISLFGLQSIDDIQVQILHELLSSKLSTNNSPSSKKKKTKVSISIHLARLLLKGIIILNGVRNTADLIEEVSAIAKETIDTTTIVICFDDLERISPALKMEDLVGYINSLVEENVKVILICNEDKLDGTAFNTYKEKIVGVRQEYNPSTEYVIHNIIANYSGAKLFQTYLQSIMPLLVELCEKNDHNYRHLIFALDFFQDIYARLKSELLDLKNKVSEKCREELHHVAKFALIMAIEYKRSNLLYTDRPYMTLPLFAALWEDEGKIKNKTTSPPANKYEEITNKYYEDLRQYYFYPSIFLAATGAANFSIAAFLNEFKKRYHLDQVQVAEYVAFHKLTNWKSLKLSHEEYRDTTNQVISYALEGKYKLHEYLVVYFFAERYDNILDLDLTSLRQSLITTMSALPVESAEEIDVLQSTNEYSSNMKAIREHGLTVYKKSEASKELKKEENVVATFLTHFSELHEKYHSDEQFKRDITHFPVLKMINVDSFFEKVITAQPITLSFFMSFLQARYHTINYSDEVAVLNRLNRQLCDHLNKSLPKTVQRWHLNWFQKELEKFQKGRGLPTLH